MGTTDPVPAPVRADLERLGVRWQQLPLTRALPHVATLRASAQRYADECAAAWGVPATELPDLGPASAFDQLVVTTHDLALVRRASGTRSRDAADLDDVGADLRALRRRLNED